MGVGGGYLHCYCMAGVDGRSCDGGVSLGFPPLAAVIAVAAINLVTGAALLYMCIGMSRDLLFSATRRQVAGEDLVRPPAP